MPARATVAKIKKRNVICFLILAVVTLVDISLTKYLSLTDLSFVYDEERWILYFRNQSKMRMTFTNSIFQFFFIRVRFIYISIRSSPNVQYFLDYFTIDIFRTPFYCCY